MRLLLDAHISGRAVGKELAEHGHDVRAMDSEIELEGLPDAEVLELALSEGRVLVSANVKDFGPLLTAEFMGVDPPRQRGSVRGPRPVRGVFPET